MLPHDASFVAQLEMFSTHMLRTSKERRNTAWNARYSDHFKGLALNHGFQLKLEIMPFGSSSNLEFIAFPEYCTPPPPCRGKKTEQGKKRGGKNSREIAPQNLRWPVTAMTRRVISQRGTALRNLRMRFFRRTTV